MSAWSSDQWQSFCLLVEQGTAGGFAASKREAWRLMLDKYQPDVVVEALRKLLVRGDKWVDLGDLLAAIHHDPSRPTFDEAFHLIFAAGGLLNTRPKAGESYSGAVLRASTEHHPLIGRFLAAQGVDRLRQLPVFDPDWGEKRRQDLRIAWDGFTDACDGRRVAALASTRDTDSELRRLDPLAGVRPPAPLLEAGS